MMKQEDDCMDAYDYCMSILQEQVAMEKEQAAEEQKIPLCLSDLPAVPWSVCLCDVYLHNFVLGGCFLFM